MSTEGTRFTLDTNLLVYSVDSAAGGDLGPAVSQMRYPAL